MKKILLIEDHDEIRENTAEILQMAGYEVYAAENGKVGIELAKNHKPSLVLCDIMMPVLDGYSVLHLFRRNADLKHIPFVFLTAKSERSDQRKAMEMGADDYLTKPFTEIELLAAIESRLDRSKAAETETGAGTSLETALASWAGFIDQLFSHPQVETLQVAKKHSFLLQGQLPRQIFRLTSGVAKEYRVDAFGKALITHLYFPGDCMICDEVLLGSHSQSNFEMVSPGVVQALPGSELIEQLKNSPQMRETKLLLEIAKAGHLQDRMLELAYTPMRERILALMENLDNQLKAHNLGEISQIFTREELAQIAGTATESLIRTLKQN